MRRKGCGMRDNEEVHETTIEICTDCKGFNTCHYGSWNNSNCDTYNDEYDAIEKEWAEEDE